MAIKVNVYKIVFPTEDTYYISENQDGIKNVRSSELEQFTDQLKEYVNEYMEKEKITEVSINFFPLSDIKIYKNIMPARCLKLSEKEDFYIYYYTVV